MAAPALLIDRPTTNSSSRRALEIGIERERRIKTAISHGVELQPPSDNRFVVRDMFAFSGTANRFVLMTPAVDVATEGDASAEWVKSSAQRLTAFLALEPRADRRRVTARAVKQAFRLLKSLGSPGVPAPALIPTFRGGVQVEWHTRGVDVEIDIDPYGRVAVDVEDLRDETASWSSADATPHTLRKIRGRLTI
jgi:hypothetical protein